MKSIPGFPNMMTAMENISAYFIILSNSDWCHTCSSSPAIVLIWACLITQIFLDGLFLWQCHVLWNCPAGQEGGFHIIKFWTVLQPLQTEVWLTLSFKLTSQPGRESSFFTMSVCPFWQANMSAVDPSWGNRKHSFLQGVLHTQINFHDSSTWLILSLALSEPFLLPLPRSTYRASISVFSLDGYL